MAYRNQVISALGGIVFGLGLLMGWGLMAGHMIPPSAPSDSAERIAQLHSDHELRIQLGMAITLATLAFLVPFGSALATQMRRMEGGQRTLADAQMGCAILTAGVVTMGMTLFAITSFRPDRNEEITYLLSDMSWIAFTMPVSGIMVWMLVTGLAILGDRAPEPVFPRWSGYFSFLGASLTAPGYLVPLFKQGPFAWNGLLAFWVALTVAFAWVALMVVLTIRGARNQHQHASAVSALA